MKLLFLSTMHGAPWGGSEELWHKTAVHAHKEGHQILVSVVQWEKEHSKIRELKELGVRVEYRTNPADKSRLSFLGKVLRKFKKLFSKDDNIQLIETFGPDRISINQGGSADVFHEPWLSFFLLQTKIPYFLTSHSFNENEYAGPAIKEVMGTLFLTSFKCFFIAVAQQRAIEKEIGRSLPQSVIIQNPIQLDNAMHILYPETSTVRWCMVSSLNIKWKSQDIVINALSSEKWKARDWQLEIYGEGPDKELLNDLIIRNGLQEKVFLRGFSSDIPSIWKRNELLLMPSRQDIVPLSMIEAMLCARPVAASTVGGITEWVVEGENGFLVDSLEPKTIDAWLENIWEKRPLWRTLGEKAKKSIDTKLKPHPEHTFLQHLLS